MSLVEVSFHLDLLEGLVLPHLRSTSLKMKEMKEMKEKKEMKEMKESYGLGFCELTLSSYYIYI